MEEWGGGGGTSCTYRFRWQDDQPYVYKDQEGGYRRAWGVSYMYVNSARVEPAGIRFSQQVEVPKLPYYPYFLK